MDESFSQSLTSPALSKFENAALSLKTPPLHVHKNSCLQNGSDPASANTESKKGAHACM
jgi:hypothetical protein